MDEAGSSDFKCEALSRGSSLAMLKHDEKCGKDLVFLYNIEDYFRKYSDIYTKKKMYSRRAYRARYIGGEDEQRRPSCAL